jgi:hypothetical protein
VPQDNKALLVDETQFSAPVVFTPFAPLDAAQLATFSEELGSVPHSNSQNW